MYLYRISCGSSLLFNKICSVLDAKSFYLSHQQHLNQLEAAVRYLTYRMYQHEVSVMSSLVKSGSGKVPIAFEGKAKVSRIKAVMKWWTKCISMVIAKTASRNVAFKSDKLMDALFQEGQFAPQTPQTVFDADFEGLTSNAELYIFNQEDSQE